MILLRLADTDQELAPVVSVEVHPLVVPMRVIHHVGDAFVGVGRVIALDGSTSADQAPRE